MKHPSSFLLLALTSHLTAVELADLAGDWSLAEMTTPARLRETYFDTTTNTSRITEDSRDFGLENEVLVDAFYPDPARSSTRTFSLSATGEFSGEETGQILRISRNRLFFDDGENYANLYTNIGGDLVLANSKTLDQQSLTIGLKRPDTLTLADLAGNWRLVSINNPTNISTNSVDNQLVDVFFQGEADISDGTISIAANGSLSGLVTGTIAPTNSGTAVATLPDETITFIANASKNVMVAATGNGEEQQFIVMTKQPAAITTAELAGTWSVSTLRVPSILTEVFYNTQTDTTRQADSDGIAMENEILVDLFHPDPFESQRLELLVSPSGNFTGVGNGGTLTGNGNGTATLNIGEDITLYPNADKTFMVAQTSDSDENEILILIKTANETMTDFEERTDLALFEGRDGTLVFNWNDSASIILEESNTLGSDSWGKANEAQDNGTVVVTPENAQTRFFRVAEKQE